MNPSTSVTTLRTLLVLGIAVSSAAAQSLMSQNHEVVMTGGDPVPGLPGVTIQPVTTFDPPQVDQNGTVVFRGRLAGGATTVFDDRAYFLGRGNGDLQLVVRAGIQAPGLPAGIVLGNSVSSAGLNGFPRLSPFGEILFFQSALYDPVNPGNTPATADTALFWGPPGSIMALAREGDQVPFLATGVTWGPLATSLQNTQINSAGTVLFLASVLGASAADDGLLVTGAPGNLSIVSREGDVRPDGAVVMAVTGQTQVSVVTQLNEAGQVLHELRFATALPSTATTANDRALAVWTAGFDAIIAREGDPAPGFPAGVVFGNTTATWSPTVASPGFTAAGNTAFLATVIGGPVTLQTDQVIYYGGIGGLVRILQKGDPAPGLGGETFGTVNSLSLSCNDAGEVAFIDSLLGATTATDSSMWAGSAGNLQLIGREGDVVSVLAPSTNGPWRFKQFNGGSNNPLLNGRGDVLFAVDVTDGPTTKTCWFASLKGLGLRLMLDTGDLFTTSGGPSGWTSLVTNAGFNSGDSSNTHFNNSGDFVCKAGLTIGTAAIVRGHVGALQAGPAAVAMVPGGTQNFAFDCGAANAFNIYVLAAGASGTRPGTLSPLGTQIIPLNFDVWTSLSLDFANTPVWTTSFGFLDAAGKGNASFNIPPGIIGWPPTLHHAVLTLNMSLVSTFVTEPVALRIY